MTANARATTTFCIIIEADKSSKLEIRDPRGTLAAKEYPEERIVFSGGSAPRALPLGEGRVGINDAHGLPCDEPVLNVTW